MGHARRQSPEPGVVERPSSGLRRFLGRALEAVVALVLVLVAFLSILGVLSLSFPVGTSLRDLVIAPQTLANPPLSVRVEAPGRVEGRRPESNPIVAHLVKTRRIVKAREADAVAWSSAQSGMTLADRDSVQTFEHSGALIRFGKNNRLDLDENTLIVLRQPERARARNESWASLLVLQGALDLETNADLGENVPVEIRATNGASIVIDKAAAGSSLRMSMNPDRTSTFSLTSGNAEVSSGGRSVKLPAGYSVTVDGHSPPGAPVRLPGVPILTSPRAGTTLTYRSAPPRVPFTWQPQPGCDASRLRIARDVAFEDEVFDRRVRGTSFTHGNLPQGRYHWRVSALKGWAEGRPTTAQELGTARDLEPPALDVRFPTEAVTLPTLLLQGAAEPGAQIFAGGQSTTASAQGDFEIALPLARGMNVVVVEAFDFAGNSSYRSTLVNAKY